MRPKLLLNLHYIPYLTIVHQLKTLQWRSNLPLTSALCRLRSIDRSDFGFAWYWVYWHQLSGIDYLKNCVWGSSWRQTSHEIKHYYFHIVECHRCWHAHSAAAEISCCDCWHSHLSWEPSSDYCLQHLYLWYSTHKWWSADRLTSARSSQTCLCQMTSSGIAHGHLALVLLEYFDLVTSRLLVLERDWLQECPSASLWSWLRFLSHLFPSRDICSSEAFISSNSFHFR